MFVTVHYVGNQFIAVDEEKANAEKRANFARKLSNFDAGVDPSTVDDSLEEERRRVVVSVAPQEYEVDDTPDVSPEYEHVSWKLNRI